MNDPRIKKEKQKLSKLFRDIPDSKKKAVEKLIENAAFMAVTLEDLAENINQNGAIITAVNGNGFETVQENPAQKSYNTMIARYNVAIKTLFDFVPDGKTEATAKAGESLAAFIMAGKPK